jgi:hypothetical protein
MVDENELAWTDRSKEECIAQFTVMFENIGKSSIDLSEAVVRAYLTHHVGDKHL